ncbi:GNAT family N-acetyltransferase [Xylocopilactobacillus apis]|uniref:N-acetyltransferase n=1 Tax=Xylocopilactobacillus apis TaxID=2932183 RepID=A0AAU9DGU9_9LACO|nr:GNAT family N-acetyltransferase [Xylocopilactobacillus apis]BDR55962.1 N-acetyltransferase [Xylocopilactobacillus apis]
MEHKYIIQLLRQEEAIEIADEWKYSSFYSFYDMSADPEDYEEIVTPELRKNNYFGVHKNGDLIGFYTVEKSGATAEIGFGMRPDLTGKGNGTGFVQAIIEDVIDHNPDLVNLKLEVACFNKRAIHLYEKLGFKKINQHLQVTNGSKYDFWLMEKILK